MGVNAVLRSLQFEPDDELLITTHTYAACRNAIDFVASRTGARIVVAALPFPVRDARADRRGGTGARHGAHATCVARSCHQPHGPGTAHRAPGRGAARPRHRDTGRRCARPRHGAARALPKSAPRTTPAMRTSGCARPRAPPSCTCGATARRELHPTVISHGYTRGFHAEFDWTGTCDPTPWLCIPEAIRFMGGLLPGRLARADDAQPGPGAAGTRPAVHRLRPGSAPRPDAMIGSMASIPLPAARIRFAGGAARQRLAVRLVPGTRRADLAVSASGAAAARLGPALQRLSTSTGGSHRSLRRLCMAAERSGIEARLSTLRHRHDRVQPGRRHRHIPHALDRGRRRRQHALCSSPPGLSAAS